MKHHHMLNWQKRSKLERNLKRLIIIITSKQRVENYHPPNSKINPTEHRKERSIETCKEQDVEVSPLLRDEIFCNDS
jgi:hypothetical protein